VGLEVEMERLRSGAAALGINLDADRLSTFQAYFEGLVSWNRRTNLTRIVERDQVQVLHFLDSLTVALALPGSVLETGRVLDVGTGAGFPGVPLKIAFPAVRLGLLESASKKIGFLERLVKGLGLSGVEVHAGRAETLGRQPDLRGRFDAVFARAVGPLPVVAELTLPFLRVGGLLVAQRRGNLARHVEEAAEAMAALGGGAARVRTIELPGLSDGRALVVVEKLAPTPDKYPRRPGAPSRRPLGVRASRTGAAEPSGMAGGPMTGAPRTSEHGGPP
jgi:16S rRNA (guanine527-N7)-methyltransferase